MASRLAFVTIGQTPRTDLVPQFCDLVGSAAEVTEYGVLDGLSADQIERLAPSPAEPILVTRLADGSQAVCGQPEIERRLRALIEAVDDSGFDAVVCLCTGKFAGMGTQTRLIEAQQVVDEAIAALAANVDRLGIVVPEAGQVATFKSRRLPESKLRFAVASPYAGGDFKAAGEALRDTEVIVMHCMGYTPPLRRSVAEASGRPVLLSSHLLWAAVARALSLPAARLHRATGWTGPDLVSAANGE